MLALRRVPLFEGLDPEDLQRVAMTAVERRLPGGRGASSARASSATSWSSSSRARSASSTPSPTAASGSSGATSAGDHIGELAVLREAPRAATVIAEGDGVRGLVIGGEGLRAILRERPDAAMAMLATLAERISRQ